VETLRTGGVVEGVAFVRALRKAVEGARAA
jgi:hypothetical protein